MDGLADGRTDGRGTEEAVRRAVGPADDCFTRADARRDGRLSPVCGRVGGRPPGKNSRLLGGWRGGRAGTLPPVRTAICNTESTNLPHPLDAWAFTPG